MIEPEQKDKGVTMELLVMNGPETVDIVWGLHMIYHERYRQIMLDKEQSIDFCFDVIFQSINGSEDKLVYAKDYGHQLHELGVFMDSALSLRSIWLISTDYV